jgi:tetratricopeptide (TPR) repeat protein
LDLRVYGREHQETARTIDELGIALGIKGDYAGAEQFYRQALVIYRKQPKGASLDVRGFTDTLRNLGLIMRLKGQYPEAESLWLEVLSFSPRLTGRDRAQVANVFNFLAALDSDRGDYQHAESMARQALEEFQKLGTERFNVAESQVNLGIMLRTEGKYAEAEPLLRDGLAVYRELLGDEHPSVAYAWLHLAQLHYLQSKYRDAEQEIGKSLKIVQQKLPPGHNAYASTDIVLGLILNQTGRSAEAEAKLREALQIRSRVFPKGNYLIAIPQGALGECLSTQKRYAEAEPLLLESYATLKAVQGERSPLTRDAARRLVTLYQSWGKPDEGARYQAVLTSSPG